MGAAREAEDQRTHQKQSAYCLMPRLNVDLPFIAASVEITLPSTWSPWYSKQRQSKLTDIYTCICIYKNITPCPWSSKQRQSKLTANIYICICIYKNITPCPWYNKQRQSKLTPNIYINIHLNLHKIYTEEAVISTLINILQST